MEGVTLYDTTLRDGSQGEGVSFTVDDKLKIVQKLDEFGMDYIEGGWPGSNPKDEEFFARVKGLELAHSEVVAFSSTKRHGIRVEDDQNIQKLVNSGVSTVAIFAKSWDFHVTEALEIKLEENIKLIEETVSYLKQAGLRVFFDAEHFFDGYLHNRQYAMETLLAAQESGADLLVLCDTNGGQLTSRIPAVYREVEQVVTAPLGIHAHNDSGLGVANTLAAYEAGAVQLQGTIGGLGERCGNADLCVIIPALKAKYGLSLDRVKLKQLTSIYYYIMDIANLVPDNQRPYVGKSAFTHKGGIHVSALQKNADTYEHVSPELWGNKRRVLVSELAGKSNFRYKLEELGFSLDDFDQERLSQLSSHIKDMEHEGYQFEGAEASLELLIRREFKDFKDFFKVDDFKIISHNFGDKTTSEAVIKLVVGGQRVHTAAEGDGPVNALDNAIRKALYDFYPVISEMKLIDYKVRVLNGNDGTASRVRVLIETSGSGTTWTTVGVSTNIIQASWKALIDSIEYGLLTCCR